MMHKFNSKPSIILGMHDAIVSLLGLIAGLYFAFTDTNIIIVSCVITSITASLSMGAANYLAVRTSSGRSNAIRAALHTFLSYMVTCILLILPFFVFSNREISLIFVVAMAVLIIFGFNMAFYRGRGFYHHFFEMLSICTIISIVAFLIGEIAHSVFGI